MFIRARSVRVQRILETTQATHASGLCHLPWCDCTFYATMRLCPTRGKDNQAGLGLDAPVLPAADDYH